MTAPVRTSTLRTGVQQKRPVAVGPWGGSVTTDDSIRVSKMPIATLIVDDDVTFRKAVRQLLERAPEVSVIGEATNGEEALQLAQELRPDVVLMDITMPHLGGLEATRRIKAERPETKVVVLTVHQIGR